MDLSELVYWMLWKHTWARSMGASFSRLHHLNWKKKNRSKFTNNYPIFRISIYHHEFLSKFNSLIYLSRFYSIKDNEVNGSAQKLFRSFWLPGKESYATIENDLKLCGKNVSQPATEFPEWLVTENQQSAGSPILIEKYALTISDLS